MPIRLAERILKLEQAHVMLWLVKDSSWMLGFKLIGTCMVIPTVAVAVWIAYHTRKQNDIFLPNVAVCFWIAANSLWMLEEFFTLPLRQPALVLFVAGLLTIVGYFLRKPRVKET